MLINALTLVSYFTYLKEKPAHFALLWLRGMSMQDDILPEQRNRLVEILSNKGNVECSLPFLHLGDLSTKKKEPFPKKKL